MWPLGVDPSQSRPQAPRPGFPKMEWRPPHKEEQGSPVKEGRVQSRLSGKFIPTTSFSCLPV